MKGWKLVILLVMVSLIAYLGDAQTRVKQVNRLQEDNIRLRYFSTDLVDRIETLPGGVNSLQEMMKNSDGLYDLNDLTTQQ